MYELNLDVRGDEIKRYVARLVSEKTCLFFSVEASHADAETAYQSVFEPNVKFAVETCVVHKPKSWTYHDLIKRQYVMSQHLWIYLGVLLVNLNVVPKGTEVKIRFEHDGKPVEKVITAGIHHEEPNHQ